MLNPKQRRAVSLLAGGHTRAEVSRQVGVTPRTLHNWMHKNVQFQRALAVSRSANPDELEALGHDCLLAVMCELKRRVEKKTVSEMDAKDLLVIVDRVGKLVTPRATPMTVAAGDASRDASGSKAEEGLVALLDDETRKRIYDELVRGLESDEEDTTD